MDSDIGTLETVVAALNSTLYNDELTLISITEYLKKPGHCMKMLNKILGMICGSKPVNLENSSPDETAELMLGIIWRLRYKPAASSVTFIENFQTEDPGTFIHIFSFLLTNVDVLKQRYYVSQFLLSPVIPSEHVMDPTIQRLTEELRLSQERFKEVHMKYLDADEAHKNSSIVMISNEISKLTLQRDQLANKLEAANTEIESYRDAKECVKLATETRMKLQEYEKQKQDITNCMNDTEYIRSQTRTLLETSEKIKGMHIATAEDAKVFLDMLQKENNGLRREVEVDLPSEMEAKRTIISICERAYDSKDVDEAEKTAEKRVMDTEAAVKEQEAKLERIRNSPPSQESNTIATLNETLNGLKQRRATVEEHKDKFTAQLKQCENQLESLLGSQTESVAEALTTGRTSSAALKRALHSYKTLSDKLRPLRTKMNISQREATIAKRTAEILSQYVDPADSVLSGSANTTGMGVGNTGGGGSGSSNNNNTAGTQGTKTEQPDSRPGANSGVSRPAVGTGSEGVSPVSSAQGKEPGEGAAGRRVPGADKSPTGSAPTSRDVADSEANQLKEAKTILLETEAELRERRASLEQQLHKLTTLRTQTADTEAMLRETEQRMQQLAAGSEGEEFRITREHNEMEKSVEALATALETATCQNNILRAKIDFVTGKAGGGLASSQPSTSAKIYQQLRDLLASYIQKVKEEKDNFQKIQKEQVARKRQKRMFENLAILAQTRMDVINERSNDSSSVKLHMRHGNDGTDVLTNPRW